MKGLSAKDLRGNDPAELRSTVRKLNEDLFKHRLKKNTNQLENTMLLRNTRREIARVYTVLAERLRAGAVDAPAAKPDAEAAEAPAAKPEKKSAKGKAETKSAAAKSAKKKES
jgi:large subunit ribosomal protein L29